MRFVPILLALFARMGVDALLSTARLRGIASRPRASVLAPHRADSSCGVYPQWPPLPSAHEAWEPATAMRTMAMQLLSVPVQVMGQSRTYDFLLNGEVSTGLTAWRESAWAWRNYMANNYLAPYDELDAAARRSSATDGSCNLLAASTVPVKSLRATLGAIAQLCDGARTRYPKLYAVLKFIPKKNGLNPLLARMDKGDFDLGLDSMQPRDFEHLNRDVRRTFNQVFLLTVTFVTLPRDLSNEMLWCSRVVVEKVKTDQRTRAMEVLCVGAFAQFSPLREVFACLDSLRGPFEEGTDSSLISEWAMDPKAKQAWERMRMVYPFLQVCYLAAQMQQAAESAVLPTASDATVKASTIKSGAAELLDSLRLPDSTGLSEALPDSPGLPELDSTGISDAASLAAVFEQAKAALAAAPDAADPERYANGQFDVDGVPEFLRRLAEASPEEKTINSLLYWTLDLLYNRALTSHLTLQLPRTQFILEYADTRGVVFAAIADVGRHIGTLVTAARTPPGLDGPGSAGLSGAEELIKLTKIVEAHTTLMQSLRDATAAGLWSDQMQATVQTLLVEYDAMIAAAAAARLPALPFSQVEAAGFGALAVLLESPVESLEKRREEVHTAMLEWRNPELLFRYYQDNLADPEMAPIVNRWMRAIFGTSAETLRDIRRRDPANLRHLNSIDQAVLARWYDKECPGTASMRTLFMIGEDAGSCLRVIGTLKNKFNRALMGYCLQSHVRVLVVFDSVKRVLARSLIRLLVRSDTREPVIYCDALFFVSGGGTKTLLAEIREQATALAVHMQIPVVHAGCTLPYAPVNEAAGGYIRDVKQLGYHVHWVDLLEIDGLSPYTYSEDLPWDEMLDQHTPGLRHRTADTPNIVVAALPRADSPSAAEYVAEITGRTAWTRELSAADAE